MGVALARTFIFFPATFCCTATCFWSAFFALVLRLCSATLLGIALPLLLAARTGAARPFGVVALIGFLALRLLNGASGRREESAGPSTGGNKLPFGASYWRHSEHLSRRYAPLVKLRQGQEKGSGQAIRNAAVSWSNNGPRPLRHRRLAGALPAAHAAL